MIAIVDYGAGNLRSVAYAVAALGQEPVITSDPRQLAAADRIIFPGVGAAAAAMEQLRLRGLGPPLTEAYRAGKPLLGICLGLQLVFASSEEDGGTPCIGWLPGTVDRFTFAAGSGVQVPHMGWNQAPPVAPHPLFNGIAPGAHFYFVHSYRAVPADDAVVLCRTEYGGRSFVSAVRSGSYVGVQFHPEKSGRHGLQFLRNFLAWDGRTDAD